MSVCVVFSLNFLCVAHVCVRLILVAVCHVGTSQSYAGLTLLTCVCFVGTCVCVIIVVFIFYSVCVCRRC